MIQLPPPGRRGLGTVSPGAAAGLGYFHPPAHGPDHPALCSLCKMPKIKKYQNCKNDVYQPDEKGYPQTVFSHSICYRVNRKTVVDNTSEKL